MKKKRGKKVGSRGKNRVLDTRLLPLLKLEEGARVERKKNDKGREQNRHANAVSIHVGLLIKKKANKI